MARHKRTDSVRKKDLKEKFPQVYFDKDSDFAAIKLAPGIEEKSYEKDGILFSEDKSGRIIEIQVLNVSQFKKQKAA